MIENMSGSTFEHTFVDCANFARRNYQKSVELKDYTYYGFLTGSSLARHVKTEIGKLMTFTYYLGS